MRAIGSVLLFLGVACLLVAGVALVFPQIRESSDDTVKRYERHAEDGTAPNVEVLGGEAKTVPWALLAAGAAMTVLGIRFRR